MTLRRLIAAAGPTAGVTAGVGLSPLVYAQGDACLSNDPAVCADCDIRREQLDSWQKSSHHAHATCNDCHRDEKFSDGKHAGTGAGRAPLAKAGAFRRQAQFRAGFVNAENSMGFHAPQHAARLLAGAIDFARQRQLALK